MAEDILGSKLYVLFVVLSTLGISYEQYPKIPLREFESILIQHKIIPDVLRTVPKFPLEVKFKDKHVTLGNTLTKEDCVDPPNITWPYMEDRVYSIAFTDIDEPGFTPGYPREWQHWLVGNIPENNMKIAEVLTEYLGLFDFHLRKRHRYCIYLFQHLSLQYMKFEELHISGPMDQLRRGFGALRFAHEYQLEIIAMNFFYAGSDTKPAKYPELSTESLAEVIEIHDYNLSNPDHLGILNKKNYKKIMKKRSTTPITTSTAVYL